MSKETNVRVTECALDRLTELSAAMGLSRDATMRQLIGAFIEHQEPLAPDDRLTHVSTVMRHPLPRIITSEPLVGKQLRLRLPDGVAERARELAFRVPGQARSRGHSDYQSRLLTDAVMTSIALACKERGLAPITDEALAGLHPLLRHRAARGLWWLAVSVTHSCAETDVFLQAARDRKAREEQAARSGSASAAPTYIEQVAVLLRGAEADFSAKDTIWHHRHRYRIVQRLAAEFLCGDYDRRLLMEQRLYDQHGVGRWKDEEAWDDVLDDARVAVSDWRTRSQSDAGGAQQHEVQSIEPTRPKRVRKSSDLTWQSPQLDLSHFDPERKVFVSGSVNIEGRGGAAVWRAERVLSIAEIPPWLVTSGRSIETESRTHLVSHPGWRLVSPTSWDPLFLPSTRPLPTFWAVHVEAGRVLQFQSGDSYVLWPTMFDDHRGESLPVPGIAAVINAIGERKLPSEIVEILLMELIPGGVGEAEGWSNRWPPEPPPDDTAGSTTQGDPFRASTARDPFSLSSMKSDHEAGSPEKHPDEDNVGLIVRFRGDVPPLESIFSTDGTAIDDDPEPEPEDNYSMMPATNSGDVMQTVLVPAHLAEEFGFIDIASRDRIIDEATVETNHRMRAALGRLPSKYRDRRKDLQAAMSEPSRFAKLAHSMEVQFHESRPLWCWPVASLAEEIGLGQTDRVLAWLADYLCRSHARELDRAKEAAHRAAMHRYAYLYE
jgi:hypothetical protein